MINISSTADAQDPHALHAYEDRRNNALEDTDGKVLGVSFAA